jgi:hypothetical protein
MSCPTSNLRTLEPVSDTPAANSTIRFRERGLPKGAGVRTRTRLKYQANRAAALCLGRFCRMSRIVASLVSASVSSVPKAKACRRARRCGVNAALPFVWHSLAPVCNLEMSPSKA